MGRKRVLSALLFVSASQILLAANPSWWSSGGTAVLDPNAPHSASENYAPANLGQLKNVAKKAAAHLESNLPGGAGVDIWTMVNSFRPNSTQTEAEKVQSRAENYGPINLGQLKAVAKPFYTRLSAAGYDPRANLIAHGYPVNWAFATPWDPATPAAENYAPANLGQVKMAFSFDLTGFAANTDTDHDGLSDAWETATFGNLSHDSSTDTDGDSVSDVDEIAASTDWNDFFNGAAPVLAIASGNGQGDLAGVTLAKPLVVQLRNSHGVAAQEGNVTFAITSTSGGALSPSTPVSVNGQGLAQASLTLPSNPATAGSAVTVTATTSNPYGSSQVTFDLSVGDPTSAPMPSSEAPRLSSSPNQSQVTISWEDNANNETAYYVERSEDNVSWTRIATRPANSTSYTDTGIPNPSRCYLYRIVAHNDAN